MQFGLSVEARFMNLPGSAKRFHAMSVREDIMEQHEALRTTPLTRALSFGAFKQSYEAVEGEQSAATLCEKYQQYCSLSPASKSEIKPGFVDTCCAFINRMWSLPKVQAILREAEELPSGTNPLEGLTKLQVSISEAGNVVLNICIERGSVFANSPF